MKKFNTEIKVVAQIEAEDLQTAEVKAQELVSGLSLPEGATSTFEIEEAAEETAQPEGDETAQAA